MPTINKASLIFRFNTQPGQAAVVTPARQGGWSESFWYTAPLTNAQMAVLATVRAAMMCPDCAVIGWRQTPYSWTLNRLLPGKSSVGTVFQGGKFTGETNSPDDTLRMRGTALAGQVAWTIFFHAIPDDVIESASFVNNNQFNAVLNLFVAALRGQGTTLPAIQWLGRDPTQQSQQVQSVNGPAGTITTAIALAGMAAGQFVRTHRVYDDLGNPIRGSFMCTLVTPNANGTVTYTVLGLPDLVRSTPSGTARRDVIGTGAITALAPQLLSSRKIGRPTLLYRGRRAKQRL
jgi:hypothetical protein